MDFLTQLYINIVQKFLVIVAHLKYFQYLQRPKIKILLCKRILANNIAFHKYYHLFGKKWTLFSKIAKITRLGGLKVTEKPNIFFHVANLMQRITWQTNFIYTYGIDGQLCDKKPQKMLLYSAKT